jgi:predicted RNA-binding Zn-ribbon protein involved in translation (DUF1610 family)
MIKQVKLNKDIDIIESENGLFRTNRNSDLSWYNHKNLKSNKNQKKGYFTINCMIKEIANKTKSTISDIINNRDVYNLIEKKWEEHFIKLIEIYLHNRVGYLLKSIRFYLDKKNYDDTSSLNHYNSRKILICKNKIQKFNSGGIEVIDLYNKIIYIFMNYHHDCRLNDFKSNINRISTNPNGQISERLKNESEILFPKWKSFLIELHNQLNNRKFNINYVDENKKKHKFILKLINFERDTENINLSDKEMDLINKIIKLKDIETKLGYKARKDKNDTISSGQFELSTVHLNSYYFYDCPDCGDYINSCENCKPLDNEMKSSGITNRLNRIKETLSNYNKVIDPI